MSLRAAALACIALVAAASLHSSIYRFFAAGDDVLFASVIPQKIFALDQTLRVEQRLIDVRREEGAYANDVFRSEMRRDTWRTYPLQIGIGVAAFEVLDRSDVDLAIARHMVITAVALLAIAWLIVIGTLAVSGEATVLAAVALLLAFNSFELLGPWPGGRGDLISFWHDPAAFVSNLVHFVLKPEFAYSVLGIAPRNCVSAIVLAAFVARWSGRDGMAYTLALVSMLFHVTSGALVIGCLLGLDFLCRPEVLRRPSVCVPVIAGVVLGVANESLFGLMGIGHTVIVAVVAAVAVMVWRGWPLLKGWANRRMPSAVTRLHAISSASGPRRDLTMFTALWAVTLPVALVGSLASNPAYNWTLWLVLHGRVLGLLLPALLLAALLVWVVPNLSRAVLAWGLASTVAFSAALVAWTSYTKPGLVDRIAGELRGYSKVLSEGRQPGPGTVLDDRVAQYGLLVGLLTRKDMTESILATARRKDRR